MIPFVNTYSNEPRLDYKRTWHILLDQIYTQQLYSHYATWKAISKMT